MPSSPLDLNPRLIDAVRDAARQAGDIARRHFRIRPGHRRAGLVQGRKLARHRGRHCCRHLPERAFVGSVAGGGVAVGGNRRRPGAGSRAGWSGSSIPSTAPEPSRAAIPIGRSRSASCMRVARCWGSYTLPSTNGSMRQPAASERSATAFAFPHRLTANPCAWPGQSPSSSGSSAITARSSICRKFRRWRFVSCGSPRAPSTLAWYLPDRRIGILQPPISSSGKPGLFFRTFQGRPPPTTVLSRSMAKCLPLGHGCIRGS